MGKWTKYRDKLDPLELDPDFKKLVDLAKRSARASCGPDVRKLSKRLIEQERLKIRLKKSERAANVQIEALSELLVDRFEDQETQRIDFQKGVSVTLDDKVSMSVTSRKDFFQYIKRTRQANLLSVHVSTLNALGKDCLERGAELPPGTKMSIRTRAKVMGLKKGANGNNDD